MTPREGVKLFAEGFVLDEGDELRVPGPEIRVTEGDLVRVRFRDGPHTIHWHGVRVPWAMDGVPGVTQSLGPGVYTYEFVAKDPGTYWYHCHVSAPSHVDFGMFGAFIVEPRDRSADPPFDREATLFLHEAAWRDMNVADGVYDQEPTKPALAAPWNPARLGNWAERNAATTVQAVDYEVGIRTGVWTTDSSAYLPFYDVFMINGKSFPDTEPVKMSSGETLRLRLVNAGQLTHTIHLHGHRGLVTHKDGSLLQAPFWADTIGMFPGERYDVYIEADNPGMWDLHDHGGSGHWGSYATNDGVYPGGMTTMLVYEDWVHVALPAPVPDGATSGDYRDLAGLVARHPHG